MTTGEAPRGHHVVNKKSKYGETSRVRMEMHTREKKEKKTKNPESR